ncbi:MAG: hypothetical protein ACRD3D_10980 [Terriglobia bacterium]
MAQYEVLRPIEFNGKVYVRASSDAPLTVRSACNGAEIAVDRGGVIELPANLAADLTLGQIAQIKPKAKK